MTTTAEPTMLRSMRDLTGYPIATDRDDDRVGSVQDFLFDDEFFTIRYMVADTGKWLASNKVLVSPLHLKNPDLGYLGKKFHVDLTKEEIENCPRIDIDAPVSRQYEEAFAKHYDQVPYWMSGAGIHGNAGIPMTPVDLARDPENFDPNFKNSVNGDQHLRSFNEVKGYQLTGSDGMVGSLEDFIVESKSWKLKFCVVDTHKFLPGGKVILDMDWLDGFDYVERTAFIDLTVDRIKSAPAFDPNEPINVDYQRNLYDYYGMPVPNEIVPSTTAY